MNIGPYYEQDSIYYATADKLVARFNETQVELGLPKLVLHKVVCPECHGHGTHVNRSIDGNGLSPDDPELDEEFWDNYRRGTYDVRCTECNGNNVVDAVDEEATAPEVLADWHDYLTDHHNAVAENLAELRFGA